MKKVGFDKEMVNILSDIVGKNIEEIRYDSDNQTGFGNIAITIENKIIEIYNIEDMNGFDEDYESSHFGCRYVDKFVPIVNNVEIKTLPINEKVKSISIITDQIDIDSQDYHIEYDMALEITTDNHKYVISRGYYYSEIITISIDKDINEIYPTSKVIEDWQDDETPIEVKVNRIRRIYCIQLFH